MFSGRHIEGRQLHQPSDGSCPYARDGERTLYYSTFHIHNQVDAGRDSYAFCPVYVISILDFNIDENRGNPDVLEHGIFKRMFDISELIKMDDMLQ